MGPATNVNDQLLIEGIKNRNKNVFEAVYKQYYKTLYLLCYRYLLNHEQAEETVHDVFIKLWNGATEITITHSLKSYLSRSVVNAALNLLKKEKTDEGKINLYTRSQEPEPITADPEHDTEAIYSRLDEALAQLPPQCRKVMMLSKFEKMKQQDIADKLGISIKTVKNHLTYGFMKIRSHVYRS